jgi:LEA14-like dessication related protein
MLAAILLAGCSSVEERLELRKPAAQLVAVKFSEANPYSATLMFDVAMENFYSVAVPVRRFTYELSSNGTKFLSGTAAVRIELPAESRATVSLPATIDYAALLKALGNVSPGSTIPYEARLQLTVETPRLGPLMLPVSLSGELALLTVPQTQ